MEIKLPSSFKPRNDSPFVKWLLQRDVEEPEGPYERERGQTHHKTHPWWQVMCLTGVDYFSTLAYQPYIAYEAAKALSPLATIVLVLVTLLGAYPVYSRIAKESPHGEGSIAILTRMLSWWQGKIFVLVLLGFAATDFIITITLSASDATAHFLENPLIKESKALAFLHHGGAVPVTLILVLLLGAVFLKGFKEAVGIAVFLVALYMGFNAVIIFRSFQEIFAHPEYFANWQTALTTVPKAGNPAAVALLVILVFPKIALGLSGFETGVAVMTLVRGDKKDSHESPHGRIKNTRKLLLTAAVIMSVFLIGSSLSTVLLITPEQFEGEAKERALAFLCHKFFGDTVGTLYDVSTILILWFAGSSALAGLLNIVPRYLPKYGMAPEWTAAIRPLVLVFTAICILIVIIFKADVHAQGGAYATGVLALMLSGAVAVTLTARKKEKRQRWFFGSIAVIFLYTLVMNIITRPDGIKIASVFILAIVVVSFISRIWRTLELRVSSVDLDLRAIQFVREAAIRGGSIRLVPNKPDTKDEEEYTLKMAETRRDHDIPEDVPILFVEINVRDASNFKGDLVVRGVEVGSYRVLRCTGNAIPNAIAALSLHIGKLTGKRPHAYFNWGERSPFLFLIRYFLSGEGDIAPLTREILRRTEPDPNRRPVIHASS